MIVYSFFLHTDTENANKFSFMNEHMHCLSEKYNGFHPIIKNKDGSVFILYAMTTDKTVSEMFKETRNMKYFKYYKTEISSSKYKMMKNNLSDTHLSVHSLADVSGKDKKPIQITFAMTDYEFEHVTDELFIPSIVNDIFKVNDSSPILEYPIFTKKLEKVFKLLKLRSAIDLSSYGGANDSDIEYYETDFYNTLSELFSKGTSLKEFEAFVHLFGNTLKGCE